MKKSVNSIDQAFKKQFSEESTPFDMDAMWQNISAELDQNEDRSPIIIWGSLLLSLVLILSILFWGVRKKSITGLEHSKSEKSTDIQISSITASPKVIAFPKLLQTKERQTQFSNKVNSIPSFAERENQAMNRVNSSLATQYEDKRYSKMQTVQRLDYKGKEKSLYTVGTGQLKKHKRILSSNSKSKQGESPLLSLAAFPILTKQQNELFAPDPDWSYCRDRRKWSLNGIAEGYTFGGVPLIQNAFSSNESSQTTPDFLTNWNESETAVSSFGGGVLLGVRTNWGLSLQSGIDVQWVVNKIQRRQTVIERITIYDEMAYYYLDENNNRIWVADSVITTRRYERNIQLAKRHRVVSVPIIAGFQFGKGTWSVGLQAGVLLSLSHTFQGSVLDPSGQIISANSNERTNIYRSNIGIAYTGGISIGYMIGEHLQLYMSPSVRYRPSSWLIDAHPIESKIHFTGLQLGMRYIWE